MRVPCPTPRALVALVALALASLAACAGGAPRRAPTPAESAATAATAAPAAPTHDAAALPGEGGAGEGGASAATAKVGGDGRDASAAAGPLQELHQTTREGLLSLLSLPTPVPPAGRAFLERTFGPDGPGWMNQGNAALARHRVAREACLEGLRASGVVVQTPEQRETCGGLENMVPIWRKGQAPTTCVDVFEFPNKACELPMVWTPPPAAQKVCELQGKRLCTDAEWNLACRGDPDGGADRRYAYGDTLDLDACNTRLAHRTACDPRGPATAWKTCSTDTEPSGAYPRCRSRFDVFDQHGNVAEVMTRSEGGRTVTQLKGSAWFYVELAKEPGQPPLPTTMMKDAAYPDHCNFDPRWHVEPIETAIHTNYHLGFRCCRSIDAP